MSYVGGPFEHDIFVSYAHGEAVDGVPPHWWTWTQRLVDLLKAEILNTDPEYRALDVFIDRDHDRTRGLTADLKARAESSAIMLVVMSSFYLDSSWCSDEGDWFQARIEQGCRGEGFFFVVRAMPTDAKRWPRHLKDERDHPLVGYPFHAIPSDKTTKPFGWPYPHHANPEYWSFQPPLSTLAKAVMRRLEEVRVDGLRREAASLRSSAEHRPARRLYLSARPDQQDAFVEIQGQLVACAYEISPYPARSVYKVGQSESAEQRLAECGKCDALLILRPTPGDWINYEIAAAFLDIGELQATARRRLPILVLDRVGGALPAAERFGLPVIQATSPDWLLRLQAQLSAVSTLELVA